MILEGTLTLRLDDGRTLEALVFGAVHAARVLSRWSNGDCGEDYQAAHGGYLPCAGSAGHAGRCGHRVNEEPGPEAAEVETDSCEAPPRGAVRPLDATDQAHDLDQDRRATGSSFAQDYAQQTSDDPEERARHFGQRF